MEVNKQPIEKQDIQEDGLLHVREVWYTMQGEGPFAGEPAAFVRLAGCNLQCRFCDTDYTSWRGSYSPRQLVEEVDRVIVDYGVETPPIKSYDRSELVVITGGEPFRQNITPFAQMLMDKGYRVQVETNGTLILPNMPPGHESDGRYSSCNFFVVCSPKTPIINKELVPYITAFKYVLEYDKVSKHDGLPTSVLGENKQPARPPREWFNPLEHNIGGIYVQPCDSQDPELNKLHIQAAVQSCMKFGYTLCLQNHKMLGLK